MAPFLPNANATIAYFRHSPLRSAVSQKLVGTVPQSLKSHPYREKLDRIRRTFSSKSTTWITLEPLNYPAVSTLIARTLYRSKEDIAHLARIVHSSSEGNPFSARSILMTLYRQSCVRTFCHILASWGFEVDNCGAREDLVRLG